MTSRLKEDERNERTIRNLLKLPENRRCINCNSLGPQYVCTNFWTFVCTTCSGIHREFTHRVKSISMAKFTSQEVSALQGGGNASAKEIYFKEWDPQRQSLPDSSNIERLRDFIRHVYVDKRYSGENRSPSFANGRGYTERSSSGGRSDEISSKNRIDGDKSSDSQRDRGMNSPSIVRSVRDIPGDKEKVSPLRVIEPPKANGPLPTQRSVSSNRSSVGEVRTESSLIDFDSVPEPPPSTAQIQHTIPSPAQPSPSSDNNWANFDSVQETKPSHPPSNTNFLDVLSELSVPVPVPAPTPASLPGGIGASVPAPGGGGSFHPPQSSPFGVSGPGWFPASQYGMGYNMQYNVPVPVSMPPAYYHQPLNQFHVHESSSFQPTMFPSMAPPSGIHRTSSLGTFSPTWMPTQSSTIQRTSSLGTPSPPFSQFMPPPPRQQLGGFGTDNTSFGSFNLNQNQTGRNPFG